MPPKGIWVHKKQQKYSQKTYPAFSPLPKARIVFRAEREPKYGRIWVNFSRGVKNIGCLFPKMVLFEGPRPSKSVKRHSNPFPRPSKSSKLGHFRGLRRSCERRIRESGVVNPALKSHFSDQCQVRLRMSCKKWRLAILFLQPNHSISQILSILGYQCGADFVFRHGFRLLRQPNYGSVRL